MQDKPSAVELLEAVAAFLSEEAARELEGGKHFHALVAANVARIVAREIALGPAQLATECESLRALLAEPEEPPSEPAPAADEAERLNRLLCERIKQGWADREPVRSRVIDHLKRQVAGKLEVDNPRFDRSL